MLASLVEVQFSAFLGRRACRDWHKQVCVTFPCQASLVSPPGSLPFRPIVYPVRHIHLFKVLPLSLLILPLSTNLSDPRSLQGGAPVLVIIPPFPSLHPVGSFPCVPSLCRLLPPASDTLDPSYRHCHLCPSVLPSRADTRGDRSLLWCALVILMVPLQSLCWVDAGEVTEFGHSVQSCFQLQFITTESASCAGRVDSVAVRVWSQALWDPIRNPCILSL